MSFHPQSSSVAMTPNKLAAKDFADTRLLREAFWGKDSRSVSIWGERGGRVELRETGGGGDKEGSGETGTEDRVAWGDSGEVNCGLRIVAGEV